MTRLSKTSKTLIQELDNLSSCTEVQRTSKESENTFGVLKPSLIEEVFLKNDSLITSILSPQFEIRGNIDEALAGPPISISSYFENQNSISLLPGHIPFAHLVSYHNGSHIDLFCTSPRGMVSLEDAVTFNLMSALNAVEIFYFIFELPKKYAWWHGLYGRDHELLLKGSDLGKAIQEDKIENFKSHDKKRFVTPFGIRTSTRNGIVTLNCLATKPGCIVDLGAIIDKSGNCKKTERTILEQMLVLY